MTWDTAQEQFQALLQTKLDQAFLPGSGLTREQKAKNNAIVTKGRKCLKGLVELHELVYFPDQDWVQGILEAAVVALESPSLTTHHDLSRQVGYLRQVMLEKAASIHYVAKCNIVTTAAHVVLGCWDVSLGILMMQNDIFTLAMGPWGLLAVGFGLAVIGAVIATISFMNAKKNYRLYQDTQLAEIDDFVKQIAPSSPSVAPGNEERAVPVQESFYSPDVSLLDIYPILYDI